jgi:hypothetical protein
MDVTISLKVELARPRNLTVAKGKRIVAKNLDKRAL